MCAIFGLLDFGSNLTPARRLDIICKLGRAAEVRGTDATGIAYVQDGTIRIQKAPRPARRMHYRIAPQARTIMGHTRMTTQGSEKKNYNNHPFSGRAGKHSFALAHNGVLFNDTLLRQIHGLPPTIIETDSYVAVQLLERQGRLDARSLGVMAEALDGSFTITVLDEKGSLYLVKGDNPLTLLHFPTLGAYLYASTQEILDRALMELGLIGLSRETIPVEQGDILKIDAGGERTLSCFDDTNLCLRHYSRYSLWLDCCPSVWHGEKADSYMEEVIEYGIRQGIPERDLRLLVDAGYDAFDMEELLYDSALRQSCVEEIRCGPYR